MDFLHAVGMVVHRIPFLFRVLQPLLEEDFNDGVIHIIPIDDTLMLANKVDETNFFDVKLDLSGDFEEGTVGRRHYF